MHNDSNSEYLSIKSITNTEQCEMAPNIVSDIVFVAQQRLLNSFLSVSSQNHHSLCRATRFCSFAYSEKDTLYFAETVVIYILHAMLLQQHSNCHAMNRWPQRKNGTKIYMNTKNLIIYCNPNPFYVGWYISYMWYVPVYCMDVQYSIVKFIE